MRGGLDPRPIEEAAGEALAWAEQVRRHKQALRLSACSEPWVEAVAYEHEVFPPICDHGHEGHGGACPQWGMRLCSVCGRWTPPQCVGSSDACDDCRLGDMSDLRRSMLQGSTSVISMRRLKSARRRNETPTGGA